MTVMHIWFFPACGRSGLLLGRLRRERRGVVDIQIDGIVVATGPDK